MIFYLNEVVEKVAQSSGLLNQVTTFIGGGGNGLTLNVKGGGRGRGSPFPRKKMAIIIAGLP